MLGQEVFGPPFSPNQILNLSCTCFSLSNVKYFITELSWEFPVQFALQRMGKDVPIPPI